MLKKQIDLKVTMENDKQRVKHYQSLCAKSKKLDSVYAYQKLSQCAVRPSARVDLAIIATPVEYKTVLAVVSKTDNSINRIIKSF